MDRRVALQVLAVVGQADGVVPLQGVEGPGQGHLAVGVVVAVGLAVGGDVDELGLLPLGVEARQQPPGEPGPVLEQVLEGDRPGDRSVVEEQGDRPAGRQAAPVGPPRVDRLAHVLPVPGGLQGVVIACLDRPEARRLVGSEDREPQAVGGQEIQALEIDRRLRQPHPLGLAAEAVTKVPDAPDDLGLLVAPVGQRQDQVAVGLGQRRAVAGEARRGQPVCLEDRGVDLRPLELHPGQQRRSEVEAHAGVVVDDPVDPPRGRASEVRIRAAAFGP